MNPPDRSTNSPKRIRLASPASPPPEPYPSRICYPNCCWLPPASSRVINLAVRAGKPNPSHQMRRFPPAVAINSYREPSDAHILLWQENQISRSIIENTVNRVVESYIEDHFVEDGAAMAADDEDDLDDTGDDDDDDDDFGLASPNLEESAILSAINVHGLQQYDTDATDASRSPDVEPRRRHQPPPPDDLLRLIDLCAPPGQNASPSAGSSGESVPEDRHLVADDDVADETATTSGEPDAEHQNFMEAAVSVAIQKKGLSHSASSSGGGGGSSRPSNR